MKILKLTALVAGVLAAMFVLGGLMLSRVWRVERTTIIVAPPEAIYPRLASFKRWTEWVSTGGELNPEVENTYSGPEQGAGATWSFKAPKQARRTLKITRAEPQAGVWLEETIEGDPSPTQGAITLAVESTGTRVTWTDEGTLAPVMGGYRRRLVEQVVGEQFQLALERLKKKVEQEVAAPAAEPAAGADAGEVQSADAGSPADGGP